MPALTEEAFRALLDDRGLLREDALEPPDRAAAYAIFAQRADARLDVDALTSQAEQFFATKLGMTVEKRYGATAPEADACRIVIASADASASGTRLCYGRAVDPADLAAANEAERRMGTYGLALLAHRCKALWIVVPETEDDRVALTIAAIFASTFLGPIVTPASKEIFGVKGAREKLARERPAPA